MTVAVASSTTRNSLAPPVVRLGYVPLTDAAPVVVADALGLFAAHGVDVVLSREASWAALRDKLAFGALDGAHLLSPLAISLAAGAGGFRRCLSVTAGLARNGNTIVLSHALASSLGDFDPPLRADVFAAALQLRAEDGLPPPTLAVVYPFSSHNYLLRHWLAAGGLDPDHDVRLVVVPPPRMTRALADGAIEGFCVGEPWGSEAVAAGAGRFALATGDIWPNHPEKVLAFADGMLERDEGAVLATTAAVTQAARWLDTPANRQAAAAMLRERAFPALGQATIAAALAGQVAAPPGGQAQRLAAPILFGAASRPITAQAGWWFDAMCRWGHLPSGTPREIALSPWRPDLWQRAAASLPPLMPAASDVAPAPPHPILQEPDA